MNRSPRQRKKPKKFTPTQPVSGTADNYLLRFEDNGELFVVKRSSIGSIINDRAIVGSGSKRRAAVIEAKGRINIGFHNLLTRFILSFISLSLSRYLLEGNSR